MLFSDLFELDHVLELLDEWARAPATCELIELFRSDSYIRRQIDQLLRRIAAVEARHGVEVGASYQAQIVAQIDDLLAHAFTPPDLAADLPVIRELLHKAHIIDLELEKDIITTAAQVNEKFIKVGEKVIAGPQQREDQRVRRAFQKWVKDNDVRVRNVEELLDRRDAQPEIYNIRPVTLRRWYAAVFPDQLSPGRPRKQ